MNEWLNEWINKSFKVPLPEIVQLEIETSGNKMDVSYKLGWPN